MPTHMRRLTNGWSDREGSVYGMSGTRLVGYDNERGKGDHRHIEDRQERHVFETVELLIANFLADVRGLRV